MWLGGEDSFSHFSGRTSHAYPGCSRRPTYCNSPLLFWRRWKISLDTYLVSLRTARAKCISFKRKDAGDLGVGTMNSTTMVLLGKLKTAIDGGSNSLWCKTLQNKYKRRDQPKLDFTCKQNYSPHWKGIWRARLVVKDGSWFLLGNGACAEFWFDRWTTDGWFYSELAWNKTHHGWLEGLDGESRNSRMWQLEAQLMTTHWFSKPRPWCAISIDANASSGQVLKQIKLFIWRSAHGGLLTNMERA